MKMCEECDECLIYVVWCLVIISQHSSVKFALDLREETFHVERHCVTNSGW